MMKMLMRIVRKRRRWPYILSVLLILAVYTAWSLLRPLPRLTGLPLSVPSQNISPANILKWPAQGQAAVGILGSSTLETHGQQAPLPTASTAKLITVLTVLESRPLMLGQQGPAIPLTANDVNIYNSYVAQGGSVVKVQAGEQISEYQMLQAILLPSANNIADSLAIWAFGSLPAYQDAAKQYLAQHDLTQTQIGSDASGYSPSTVSSAQDLVKVGELAMGNPVLASIVSQASVDGFPVVNTIKNVNWLLGTDGIVGVKTGNTDQAGGVYVSASRVTVNAQPLTIVTAVTGLPSLAAALNQSLPLIQSSQASFQPVSFAKSGTTLGRYPLPWGGSVLAAIDKNISLKTWAGKDPVTKVSLLPISLSTRAGSTVGQLHITINTAQHYDFAIKLRSQPGPPSLGWRLRHPF